MVIIGCPIGARSQGLDPPVVPFSGDSTPPSLSGVWAGEVSPPAVGPVGVDGVGVEVHLNPGEASPPDRERLTVGPGPPDEAEPR